MGLIKLIFKLLVLPLIVAVTLIQWVGIFFTQFSTVICIVLIVSQELLPLYDQILELKDAHLVESVKYCLSGKPAGSRFWIPTVICGVSSGVFSSGNGAKDFVPLRNNI